MVTSSAAWFLRLGDFDMSPGARSDCDVQVATFRRGRPVPVTRVVDSQLQDGALEEIVRHDNRDQLLLVGFKAADARVQAEVEEDLILECRKSRNELAWTPPDGYGATSVFDVVTADPEFVEGDDWDLDEVRGYRWWQVTFRSLSFARAETLTTVPALASGVTPASTTIADGTSATNWTGTSTVTASGGTLRQTVPATVLKSDSSGTLYGLTAEFTYTPGSPMTSFATEPYLYLDGYAPTGAYTSGGNVNAYADGVLLDLIAVSSIGGGGTRYYFNCPDTSVAVLKVRFDWSAAVAAGGTTPAWLFQIDNVTSTNQAPSTSATPGRESLRTVEVNGSARTPASLAIEHSTNGLGQVLVYTNPALAVGGYAPNLRVRRASGSTSESSSSGLMSGKLSSVGTAVAEVFRVPTLGLPRGGYLLLAMPYLSGDGFTDVEVTASTRLSTGALIGTKTTRNRNVQTVAGFQVLADLTLPHADVPASSDSTVEISVLSMSGSAVQYDEMFLCALGDDAALTLVDCGATTGATLGTANSRLWIESASIDRPAPTIWLGTAAGKADAYHAGDAAGSWMPHQFVPPSVTVFVANTGGANPAVSATYYERAHTHIVGRS